MLLSLTIAVLAIDPRASRIDVSGGAAAEIRGGVAPRTPLEDPEPTFLTIVTPNVDLEIRHRRGGTFNLGVAPRVQYRAPNRLSLARPLFFGQAYAAYDVDLDRRWRLASNAGFSAGELDYTGVVFALGTGQANTFDLDVAQLAFGSAGFDLDGDLTPTQSIRISPLFQVRAPIGETARSAEQGLTQLPTQLNGFVALGHQAAVSDVDSIETTLRPGVVDYDDEVTFVSAEGRVGWERQLRPALRTYLDMGVFGARRLRSSDTPAVEEEPDTKVFPVGALRITGRLYGAATHEVEGNVGVGAQGFFDRISERVEPRGNLTAGITTYVPPRWSAGISLNAFTALTVQPRPVPPAAAVRIPETVVAGTTPVGYRVDDNTTIEFGTVVSVRASHLADPAFEFRQFEAWLYFAVRIAGGTARGGREIDERTEPIGLGAQGFNAVAGAGAQ